jgi:hypothetical protein
MPTPVQSTRDKGTTSSGAVLKLFSSGAKEGRCGIVFFNRDPSSRIKARVVPAGSAAPSMNDGDEMYTFSPGETFNFSPLGAWYHDVYIWGENGAVANYVAEELV